MDKSAGKPKLYIGTMEFPYGKGEKNFIVPELQQLQSKFDITIISTASEKLITDNNDRALLANDIKVICIDYSSMSWIKKIQGLFIALHNSIFRQECIRVLRVEKKGIKCLYQTAMYYIYADFFKREVEKKKIIKKNENVLYYTYWYHIQTLAIALLNNDYPQLKLVTRAHRFDLYNEAFTGNRQPFRTVVEKNIKGIFFISTEGLNYYASHFNRNKLNIGYHICRLGTSDAGIMGPTKNDRCEMTIVSCSAVIVRKRINLIIEALSNLESKYCINWIHFGGGDLLGELQCSAEDKLHIHHNIKYRFVGYASNENIKKYYREHVVDCFISTSASEGVAVSVQEALAYGIPVIATDVGGTKEMISGNGVLLDSNPSIEEICNAICLIYGKQEDEMHKMRERSLEIWKKRFCADDNAKKFCQLLLTYTEKET